MFVTALKAQFGKRRAQLSDPFPRAPEQGKSTSG